MVRAMGIDNAQDAMLAALANHMHALNAVSAKQYDELRDFDCIEHKPEAAAEEEIAPPAPPVAALTDGDADGKPVGSDSADIMANLRNAVVQLSIADAEEFAEWLMGHINACKAADLKAAA